MLNKILKLFLLKKIPVLVGGTGLYIYHIINGFLINKNNHYFFFNDIFFFKYLYNIAIHFNNKINIKKTFNNIFLYQLKFINIYIRPSKIYSYNSINVKVDSMIIKGCIRETSLAIYHYYYNIIPKIIGILNLNLFVNKNKEYFYSVLSIKNSIFLYSSKQYKFFDNNILHNFIISYNSNLFN